MIHFALIGCGRFGKHYLSNIQKDAYGSVEVVCTRTPLPDLAGQPYKRWCSDYKEVCKDPGIDCVIVATPPAAHYEICLAALSAGKHVICEKPFVYTPSQAEELGRIASQKGLILLINYIHLWNSKLQTLFNSFNLKGTEPHFIDFQATCLGPFRKEYSMLWDWYSHDLALLFSHLPEPVTRIESRDFLLCAEEHSGVLTVECEFTNVKAHSFVSNLCGTKRKLISITGPQGTSSYEDDFKGNSLSCMLREFAQHHERRTIISNARLATQVTRILSALDTKP